LMLCNLCILKFAPFAMFGKNIHNPLPIAIIF